MLGNVNGAMCHFFNTLTQFFFAHLDILSQKSVHFLVKCVLQYDVYFFVTYRIYKNYSK